MLNAYAARDFRPIWTGRDRRAAEALLAAMGQAFEHGLPSDPRRVALLRGILEAAPRDGSDPMAEIALADAWLDYARVKLSGLIAPSSLSENLHVFPVEHRDDELLFMVASAPDPAALVAGVEPPGGQYEALQQVLADLRAVIEAGGWGPEVASGPLIRPGDSDPRVPALRERLAALGDYAAPPEPDPLLELLRSDPEPVAEGEGAVVVPDPTVFDPGTEEALRAFQRRHGLNEDGVVGPATLAALNTSAEERARQVLVNLERERWKNGALEPDHIYVNLADFRMWVREGGEDIFTTRVVVGQSQEHETPEFVDRMTFLVANPTWTVPRSIATEEILPQLRTNPAHLQENNMILLPGGGGEPVPEDSALVDWSQFSVNYFPWWIRQAPGPGNALGRVKFMFPNQFAIYLHDTPSRSLFRRDVRDFSHGCVRVQDPIGLMEVLLAPQMDNPRAEFQSILDTGVETEIPLRRPIPVHLDYRTVRVEADGTVHFRQDVYLRDTLVYEALEEAGVSLFGVAG
ncbi:MAG: L,D-transpeptidase family protein [Rubricella sp.]